MSKTNTEFVEVIEQVNPVADFKYITAAYWQGNLFIFDCEGEGEGGYVSLYRPIPLNQITHAFWIDSKYVWLGRMAEPDECKTTVDWHKCILAFFNSLDQSKTHSKIKADVKSALHSLYKPS